MLRGILTNNFGWKFFSVLLAVALWLTIRPFSNDPTPANCGTMMTRIFNEVPVLVVSAAADVREFDVKPDTVQVTVSGKPDVIAALEAKSVHAIVDLTDFEAARELHKRVDVSTLPGVTVLNVFPANVDIVVPAKTVPTTPIQKP